jgi:hypothetical protein
MARTRALRWAARLAAAAAVPTADRGQRSQASRCGIPSGDQCRAWGRVGRAARPELHDSAGKRLLRKAGATIRVPRRTAACQLRRPPGQRERIDVSPPQGPSARRGQGPGRRDNAGSASAALARSAAVSPKAPRGADDGGKRPAHGCR